MSYKNRITSLDNLSLHLKSNIGIYMINYPYAIIVLSSCWYTYQLFIWNGGADHPCLFITVKRKFFSKQVLIPFKYQLLSISDELIISKNVLFIHFRQLEYGPCHWTWVLAWSCWSDLISLFNIWNFVSNVNN
jgi:hypothetical protein